MIVAVVLAAGESSRMGRPKALLPIEGKSFIERIVTELQRTAIEKIIVVLGHKAAELRPKIEHLPVTILVNPDYKNGQLSSLQVALRHLLSTSTPERIDGVVVHLVDHPYIDASLVDTMIRRFYDSQPSIVVPRFGERRGHPVIFSASLFRELLEAPLEEGAKAVVKAHRDATLEVETAEAGITIDIDTPDEYRRHVKESDV
jgi:molybdenum cofactor cytidylyltransferase